MSSQIITLPPVEEQKEGEVKVPQSKTWKGRKVTSCCQRFCKYLQKICELVWKLLSYMFCCREQKNREKKPKIKRIPDSESPNLSDELSESGRSNQSEGRSKTPSVTPPDDNSPKLQVPAASPPGSPPKFNGERGLTLSTLSTMSNGDVVMVLDRRKLDEEENPKE